MLGRAYNQTGHRTGEIHHAISEMSNSTVKERGAVHTRREIVDFILDLVDYTLDQKLAEARILEPSFGDGEFMEAIVQRLLASHFRFGGDPTTVVQTLPNSIRAVEVNAASFEHTQQRLLRLLAKHGVAALDAWILLSHWLVQDDFLLTPLGGGFTHVVGNPPYVRQELIPEVLIAEYRERYDTIYDRADLYVPFIERSLTSLEREGVLGFICSDRWMKNRYGGPLRAMVSDDYHLLYYVDMVDTPAFDTDVIAYPAIVVIKRGAQGRTRIAHRPGVDGTVLSRLATAMRADTVPAGSGVIEAEGIVEREEPWIVKSFDKLAVVRRLEEEFPTLEEAGCRVGIGVATGADRVFIRPFEDLDVEPDRKLPLVRTKDIESGKVEWRGFGVINPFRADGRLVTLADYPRLARYLDRHADVLRRRHCAKKNPAGWYRTIDRIHPQLTYRPKLLIPDIKGEAHIVYEEGRFYPHHNLYYITSEEWDLKALQSVLSSGIAELFVSTYSTRMRGGYLRFQAQYLRRIRIPEWSSVPQATRSILTGAADAEDAEIRNNAVFDLYGLTPAERTIFDRERMESGQ